jgi:hypothetical protein
MSCGAERAIRVGDTTVRVAVNSLNSSADKDQSNAHKHEEKLPRALPARSGTLNIHGIATIAHDISVW